MPEPREVDALLVDLAMHPGWQVLEQRIEEHHAGEAEDLGRALLRGVHPVDQLQIERARGFWAGQRWVLRQVRHELSAFQRQTQTTE